MSSEGVQGGIRVILKLLLTAVPSKLIAVRWLELKEQIKESKTGDTLRATLDSEKKINRIKTGAGRDRI